MFPVLRYNSGRRNVVKTDPLQATADFAGATKANGAEIWNPDIKFETFSRMGGRDL
jgi:hypothetical protein